MDFCPPCPSKLLLEGISLLYSPANIPHSFPFFVFQYMIYFNHYCIHVLLYLFWGLVVEEIIKSMIKREKTESLCSQHEQGGMITAGKNCLNVQMKT